MTVMIEAQDLSKYYGPVAALKNASFEVRRGEVLGFLGPNGAGKTTTMKILTCFISPSEGTAKVNGCDVFDDPVGARRAVGYLPESTPLYVDMLVLEYLEFMAKMRHLKGADAKKRIKKVVEQTGLGDVIAKEIRALSKGYRQRVGLAQAMVHEPPVLILDEPMSGLDPNQAVEIRDVIREIGRERTVILSTHNLAEVQITCGRVLIVAKGRIVADDTPDELQARTGKPKLVVTVLSAGAASGDTDPSPKIRDILGAVTGVETVRPVKTDAAGELVFDVVPRGQDDLRPEIFRAAVDNHLTLVGLHREGENLENIFRQLTTAKGPADTGDEGPKNRGNQDRGNGAHRSEPPPPDGGDAGSDDETDTRDERVAQG